MNNNINIFIIIFFLLLSGCSSTNKNINLSDDGSNKAYQSRNKIVYDDGTNKNNRTAAVTEKQSDSKSSPVAKAHKPDQKNSVKNKSLSKSSDKKVVVVKKSAKTETVPPTAKSQPEKRNAQKVEEKNSKPKHVSEKSLVFYYPIDTIDILRDYSISETSQNPGIDFNVPNKTPIKSASPGWVIFAGKKSGVDGNLVILFHNEKFLTIFSNLDSINVKKGDYIKNIDSVLGYANSYLHFEMRQQTDSGIKTLNPNNYLVKR